MSIRAPRPPSPPSWRSPQKPPASPRSCVSSSKDSAGSRPIGRILFLLISIATLVLGNVVAIVQTNIKRMLAYSSIAHAGYALIGFVAAADVGASGGTPGLASVMIYLALYTFMTLGAFAVIGMLRKGGVEGEEIEDFAGSQSASRSRLFSC